MPRLICSGHFSRDETNMHSPVPTGTPASSELSAADVEHTYRKIFFRLIPLLFLCYVVKIGRAHV